MNKKEIFYKKIGNCKISVERLEDWLKLLREVFLPIIIALAITLDDPNPVIIASGVFVALFIVLSFEKRRAYEQLVALEQTLEIHGETYFDDS